MGRSGNDQRSDVKNPNNPDHKHDMDNRSDQKNPTSSAYPHSEKESEK